MGSIIQRIGKETRNCPGLSGYTMIRHPHTPIIMGGGEIGDARHFQIALDMAGSAKRLAACGINPVHNFASLNQTLLSNLASIPYISVRSRVGAELMRDVLSRSDIDYSPDPAFALFDLVSKSPTISYPLFKKKKLAISLATFYLSVYNYKVFAPDHSLKTVVADPEFARLVEKAGSQYIKVMRRVVKEALSQGWTVVNIPFSEVDAMFADTVLADLNVERKRYTGDFVGVINCLQDCQKMVATRFHSHIFGFLAGVPLVSIAYAGKCQYLWSDLGLCPGLQISRMDICQRPDFCVEKIISSPGEVISRPYLKRLADSAVRSIVNAFHSIN